jgi:hypothetical protein
MMMGILLDHVCFPSDGGAGNVGNNRRALASHGGQSAQHVEKAVALDRRSKCLERSGWHNDLLPNRNRADRMTTTPSVVKQQTLRQTDG